MSSISYQPIRAHRRLILSSLTGELQNNAFWDCQEYTVIKHIFNKLNSSATKFIID